MWLADTSIKRPVFATMMIASLVILGVVSYPDIGLDLYPKVDYPMVTITTTLKGASPEIMDIDVTDKIEEAVNTINGVKSISSSSTEETSVITIEFILERNIDLSVQDVREKVSSIRSLLPKDILEPIIQKVDPDATPILWLNLTGRKSVRDLSTYADEVLKNKIQRINGVGAIQLSGLRLRQVRIWLSIDKLSAHQITAQDISNALSKENIELPGGRIESKTKEYGIKIKGEFRSPQQFNELIIGYDKGTPIRIQDVGRAEDSMEEKRSIARFNGKTTVALGVQKQSGTNTVAVIKLVKKELENIKTTLPPGMAIDISFDQSTFIQRSINEVKTHLIYGGIFAALAVLLFLKSFRITLISALAIPTSVIATFYMIYFFNFTFNDMTMLALSLSIGILIDDAIIVIENIHRHIETGLSPKEASSKATSEIGLAVMATTMAVVAIFLPVAFMKGMIGRFFLQFALTVVFSVMFSLFVSFTLTPMLSSKFLKRTHHSDPSYHKTLIGKISDLIEKPYFLLENMYRKTLDLALRHRIIVITCTIIIFILSLYLTNFIGKELIPPEDQGSFIIRLEAPIDYSIDQSDKMFNKVENYLKSLPEVKSVFYSLGTNQGEINKATMFVTLTPKIQRKRYQDELKSIVRKKLNNIVGLKASAEDVTSFAGEGQERQVPIQLSIRGIDLKVLEHLTKKISAEVRKIKGFVDIDTSLKSGKPELRVFINRDKAADLSINAATIGEAINFLIGGEVDITKYKDERKGRRYDVRVRLFHKDRSDPKDIEQIYVRSNDNRLIKLQNIIDIKETGGPNVINRVDRQRAITLFANLEGKTLGQAKQELDKILSNVLSFGYSGRYKGSAELMSESFQYLYFALILGIILAYMILASQFESFIHPFTILLSMPFSFIGAFGALYLANMTLNIYSYIGLILLMGLVKKNAILLVDYTNTLRNQGMERKEAILKAGPVRLRPILMTTMAMVFGMLPIALATGEGAESRAPMAVATIGGLMSSLFLTLIVVPVVYDLFDEIQSRFKSKNIDEDEDEVLIPQ